MAKIVVWEIEQDAAHVLIADVRGRAIRIEKSAVWPLAGADAAAFGKKLQSLQLPQRTEMIAVFGRQDVEIKLLSLPPAPDDELPDMVRFQSQRELSAADSASIDFLPLAGDASKPRTVLAAALNAKARTFAETAAATCGIKLIRICLHGAAAGACISPNGADGAILVEHRGNQAELVATDARGVRFLRSIRIPEHDGAEALAVELKRSLTLLPGQVGIAPEDIYIACDDEFFKGFATTWRARGNHELSRVVVRDLVNSPTSIEHNSVVENLGLVGALLEYAGGRAASFDFANPRKAAAKPDQTKHYRIAAILGVGAVAASALVFLAELRRRDNLNDALRTQMRSTEKRLVELAPEMARHEKMSAWKKGDVVWLDELAALSKKLPNAESVAVKSVTFRAVPSHASHAAEIALEGWAKDGEAVSALQDALRWEKDRTILPGRQSQKAEMGYSTDFVQTTLVRSAPPANAYSQLFESNSQSEPSSSTPIKNEQVVGEQVKEQVADESGGKVAVGEQAKADVSGEQASTITDQPLQGSASEKPLAPNNSENPPASAAESNNSPSQPTT